MIVENTDSLTRVQADMKNWIDRGFYILVCPGKNTNFTLIPITPDKIKKHYLKDIQDYVD